MVDKDKEGKTPIGFIGGSAQTAKVETISAEMLWQVANAIRSNEPFNLDRVLGGSYNTRSDLEALLVHTPQFYFCYLGRIERISDQETVKSGHKHLIWCSDEFLDCFMESAAA